ncbi:MAG: hypothetical protein ACK4N5_22965, partial [Myxococcales bacterium]
GKGTQTRLLAAALRRQKRRLAVFSFPSYDKTLAGGLVGAYLDGSLGDPRHIDSRLAAVLFALDRFERKAGIEKAMKSGALVLCDRYVGSNLAHQAARTPEAQRPDLRRLIERLEYGVLGLPRPSLVLYLDMPDALAQERVKLKGERSYTRAELDAHEADRRHLGLALAEYRRQAAARRDWVLIRTVDADGTPRTREAIHADIMAALVRRGIVSEPRRPSRRR